MKKLLSIVLALVMLASVFAFAEGIKDYSGYTIRIYSNSNSTERVTWLVEQAKKAGFSISLDDNSVISGDTAAIQRAQENKDGDILFGLNETRWGALLNGDYEGLSIMDWTPAWADEVGNYKYEGKAYGLVVQNVLMLYRLDDYGTKGEKLHFQHWSDIVNAGYTWYRQGKVGGTTNSNINSAMLYPYADPESPAGGISIEGWKTLWAYCAGGIFTGDSYGFDPLNRGDVAIVTFYSSSLYGKVDAAATISEHPLIGALEPENWELMEIDDGTYYIAEYIGIIDREGRTEEQTEAVKAFAEWFASAEVQASWADEFDSFPCNEVAVEEVYGDDIPGIYRLKNFALNKVEGTDMTYAAYVAAHSAEWTNIMTNLGFYWADANAPAEPDWDNLDWATLTQKK
ncbi:MAG: extracellular solute-binding protein [Clostridia bacterium]|nr:extracellular solute-binding protein [Clostridia bacterium]